MSGKAKVKLWQELTELGQAYMSTVAVQSFSTVPHCLCCWSQPAAPSQYAGSHACRAALPHTCHFSPPPLFACPGDWNRIMTGAVCTCICYKWLSVGVEVNNSLTVTVWLWWTCGAAGTFSVGVPAANLCSMSASFSCCRAASSSTGSAQAPSAWARVYTHTNQSCTYYLK